MGCVNKSQRGPELAKKLLWVLPDAGNAVAHEADENGFGGRLAINPVLDVVPLRITLANFVFRFADSGHYFFAIHSNGGTAILNGFLHFGRQRIHPLHGSGALLREIKKW